MIDTDKYEERLRTTMDYMKGFHNGDWNEKFKSCPHCDEKEWPDSSCSCGYGRIPDILMHVQWSHDELFGPLHETASDLLTEVKRLRKIEQEHGRVTIDDWEHKPHGDADAHPLPYVTVYHDGCEYTGCLRLYKNEDGYSDEYSYLRGDEE